MQVYLDVWAQTHRPNFKKILQGCTQPIKGLFLEILEKFIPGSIKNAAAFVTTSVEGILCARRCARSFTGNI